MTFRETRVPVTTLLEYLQFGKTIGQFLADYPSVDGDQVAGYLSESHETASNALVQKAAVDA